MKPTAQSKWNVPEKKDEVFDSIDAYYEIFERIDGKLNSAILRIQENTERIIELSKGTEVPVEKEQVSFTNILGTDGSFKYDSNSDGLGDGFGQYIVGTQTNGFSIVNGKQFFTHLSQYSGIQHPLDYSANLYMCCILKNTTDNMVKLVEDSPAYNSQTVSGVNEETFCSFVFDSTETTKVYIETNANANLGQTMVAHWHVFDLDKIQDVRPEIDKDWLDTFMQKMYDLGVYVNGQQLYYDGSGEVEPTTDEEPTTPVEDTSLGTKIEDFTDVDNNIVWTSYSNGKKFKLGNPYAYSITYNTSADEYFLYDLKGVEVLNNIDKLSNYPNISASNNYYTGNMSGNTLTMTTAHDFEVGHGIYIGNDGDDRINWLVSTVTAVSGNTLTLANSGTYSSAVVGHDDSVAVQNAIDSTQKDVLVWDLSPLCIHDLSLKSNLHHFGNGCELYSPKYLYQTTPNRIWGMFNLDEIINISMIDFNVDGGKQYGVGTAYIQDQYGTSIILSTGLEKALFLNFNVIENYYVANRMLNRQHDIKFLHCSIEQTDVAICFMPEWLKTSMIQNIDIYKCHIHSVDCNSEAIAFIPAWYKWINNTTQEVLAYSRNIRIIDNYIVKKNRVALSIGALSQNVDVIGNYIEGTFCVSTMDAEHGTTYGELKFPCRDENNNNSGTVDAYRVLTNDVRIKDNTFGYAQYQTMRLAGYNYEISNNTWHQNGYSRIITQNNVPLFGIFEIHDENIDVNSSAYFMSGDWNGSIGALEKGCFGDVLFHNNSIAVGTTTPLLYLEDGTFSSYSNSKVSGTLNIVVPSGSTIADSGIYNNITYS